MTPWRWLGLFVVVAILGTLADRWFHHALGILHYPDDTQPIPTVLLVMGTGGVVGVAGVQWLGRVWPWPEPLPRGANVAIDATLALGAYALTGIFGTHTAVLTVALVAVWAVRATRRGRTSLGNALSMAVCGPLVEAVLIGVGLFAYDDAICAGPLPFPAWLPALYLHMALTSESAGRWLEVRETAPLTRMV